MFALKLDQNNIFYHFSQQAQQRRLNSSITQCNLSRIISCLNHRLPRLYTFFHMYNHSPNPMYFRRRTKNLPYIFTALLWEAPAIVASKRRYEYSWRARKQRPLLVSGSLFIGTKAFDWLRPSDDMRWPEPGYSTSGKLPVSAHEIPRTRQNNG